jgi:dGTPase
LSVTPQRHHRPYGGHSDDARLEFSKDYDHILYSSAFRRLGGVTQVVGVNETALFHNRLTHSLKVAQVGRRLTNKLWDKIGKDDILNGVVETYGGGLDSRVVNAACIAHDLGHPPFGHIAEAAFQKILSGRPDTIDGTSVLPRVGEGFSLDDSFEGNAQTFRIVNKLAFRESYDGGKSAALNLTKATLAAIQKYPWPHRHRPEGVKGPAQYKKWGYYDSEDTIFRFATEDAVVPRDVVDYNGVTRREFRTVEAQVMDWADDISYAIHDVEDFFRAGLIPLDTLAESDRHFVPFFEYAWNRVSEIFVRDNAGVSETRAARFRVESWLEGVRQLLPATPYAGTRANREDLHTFASAIIRGATDNVTLTEDGIVLPAERERAIIEIFKQLTWYYVIERPSLSSAQRGQVYLIRQLFRDLTAWVLQSHPGRLHGRAGDPGDDLPPRLSEYVRIALHPDPTVGCVDYDSDEHKIRRAVVDYIVSLTESQAVELSARLHGATSRSILESWFHI